MRLALSFLLLLCAVPAAIAQPQVRDEDKLIMSSEGFLGAHPDLKYRLSGLQAYEERQYRFALSDFRRAARYADKPSQGMLAEMHWQGEGVPVDRATAYAWMDLAAERAYPLMLVKREGYWAALTPGERERAIEVGTGLYAEYGDEVAKPRLEAVLRKARRATTGSRVGAVGFLQIHIPTPSGFQQIDGTQYYQAKFWEPELYWRWQDQDWKEPGEGRVEVGEVMPDTGTPPEQDSDGEPR